jgi:hypothetical protein
MFRPSRTILSFGAGALAVMALTLAGPKAAHAIAATLVQVTNTSSSPVINQDVDSPGRSPYTAFLPCYSQTTNSCTAFFPAVPAGMRLVVEFISSSVDTPTSLSNVDFYGNGAQASPLFTLQGNDAAGNKIYIANQPMLAYFEAGQTPSVAVFAQSANFEFVSGSVTLTGHLVNLSQ